ncbi:adenylate cyclase (ATP pyrophosphate-lyase) (Adenylyl cyclase) [Scheffersomyces stipitis CBS 6054]|uniref:Adenylate cyclase n=1 Tax=Scheffersomyces stipitis (strain ATCC 58785 / CBS 6054 / NBRC 10063 / NRRL Y-11545) TaxID=322104 RepID=A3LSN1_PICST|nr:adenylate cyclase (ATP pyrophosphate-lyase) (Adenylyl cyclase) [Scheffersomyces stipitis CBS 6054]ABN65930.2 adenylate cyclase (ATP pyrophosphate-lyase) (Adenylyl cyclase) [Scheffersomyces stipitis CBS 6054]
MSFLRRDKSKNNLNASAIQNSTAYDIDRPLSPTANLTTNRSPLLRKNTDTYSPRSSIVSLPSEGPPSDVADSGNDSVSSLKDNYRGFHANRRPKAIANIPPLSQPIKPRFKKKSGSLLGKLIYSSRKDSDSSAHSGETTKSEPITEHDRKSASSDTADTVSKHKFRMPSISLEHHHHHHHHPHHPSLEPKESDSDSAKVVGTTFDLDMNLDEMHGIIKSPEDPRNKSSFSDSSTNAAEAIHDGRGNIATQKSHISGPAGPVPESKAVWKAPDSWDVQLDQNMNPIRTIDLALSDSDDTDEKEVNDDIHNHLDVERQEFRRMSDLPVLYGTRQSSHIIQGELDSKTGKPPNHIVRVFREDNTFTTILCSLETTTAELLAIAQRKFFLESISNYQISVYIGNCVKVLEPFEKPLKIQLGLLLLSGYTDNDNLKIIGREDLSYLCKFVVENINLRNLTHEEETMLSRDYVDVNIAGLNLKNIPIIFHQHTYEIEKLNVADNPSIYIPLDFIQSCNNLISINFSKNGCSKFPLNFLEAKKLTHLDMEKNFLDDLPSKFSHLKNLTHLKLNSNQLTTLPKSFSRLKNLEVLNLSSNYFSVYPESISELSNLKDLDMSYNDLASLPESINKLTNLSKLNLCTNKLSKSLPDYFAKMTALKRLDIRYNLLSNVDVLGSLPNLEVAYFSKNNVSAFVDQMENMRLLHFDRNPITSLHFDNMLQYLTIVDLSKAKITSIPDEFITKIPNIEKFVLDKNHLVTLPNELGNLQKLASLSVFGNNLSSLPSTIGKLSSLQILDIHSNNLQSLPDDIWLLKSLSVLNVSSNILSSFPKPPISVAKRVSSTNRLLVLTLADNRLGDDCFESISFLVSLKSLNLSYNDILEIPEGAMRRLTRLTEVYLSGNEIATLPADDLENLKALKLLFVNNNKLVSLPAELSKLTNLQHLDVGSNQLKYNISNWPYDWSWHWNKNLKYLNFSGNKRFEIKSSHVKNQETGEFFDSLLVLKNLKVLGLIDVTLTTTAVPDQSTEMRIRTTSSELDNIGYGVSDSMGLREFVSSRDVFIQKFRGNENEVLICTFDGKRGAPNQGHRVSSLAKNLFVSHFTHELEKVKSDEEINDALRRTFLSLNKEINGILAAKKCNSFAATPQMLKEAVDLNLADDGRAGCSVTVIYIKDKKLYTANCGDTAAILSRNNGDHVLLTNRHDPTSRSEFERIRASGGYVSGDGALDGDLPVARGVGFFNYLPHTHSGPDISSISLTAADDMIVVANKIMWDYISYELAVDILRQEKDDPMLAAQKLRDYAICYGATDKIAVIVITLGEQKSNRSKFGSNGLYNNLGRESDVIAKKRRDRVATTGDSSLRRLDDEIEPPVGELALVFTDIKNSTLLWDAYPVPMRSAIKTHNSIMRRQLRIVGGYEVKTEGDAFMVSFPSPTSALLWCFNVQQNLLTADWPSEILETDQCCEVTDGKGQVIFRGLSVRMGIHWGSPVCETDVVTGRMDYFGPMVNRASRISAVADGGQIAVSSDFLDEFDALHKIHEEISEGKMTLFDAYQGNPRAGEIIEREIASIEDNGYHYFKLGERKLKGLETPEPITLVYTSKLKIRFEIFEKRMSQNQEFNLSTRVVGALPVDSIYGLRTISLRLENICSGLNGGSFVNEGFSNSSGVISEKMNTTFKEGDLIALLNHIVTRIESCVTTLYLRQQMSIAHGEEGVLDIKSGKSLNMVMDDVALLVRAYREMLKIGGRGEEKHGYIENLG